MRTSVQLRAIVFCVTCFVGFVPCAGAQKAKLTRAQVEQMIQIKAPDDLIATQVRSRGISFPVTGKIVDALAAKGAGPNTVAALRDQIHLGRGKVQASTQPRSRLFLDGKDVGTAGLDGSLVLEGVVEGDHELVSRSEGYRDSSSKFSLASNEVKQISLPMEWLGGFLSVSAQPASAKIQVFGPRPFEGSANDAQFPPGDYRVDVSSDGYITQKHYFKIGAGEHHVEKFQLIISLEAMKAKAFAGDAASLDVLIDAVSHGSEVSFPMKYHNISPAISQYTGFQCFAGPECGPPGSLAVNLRDGVVTLSKTSFAFDGACIINRGFWMDHCDFHVSPSKILRLENQPQRSSRIHVQVAIPNKKGNKEDKKDYYFYNAGTVAMGSGTPGGEGTSFVCNGCDDSMNVLYTLLQKVRGMN